jgi:SAM-dependent methyltransferase/uncharacterized protein YbaR (Trm112 family)
MREGPTPAPTWHVVRDVLICPHSRTKLRLATHSELELVRQKAAASESSGRPGGSSSSEIEAVLVSEEGGYAYCVADGILELVRDRAFMLEDSDDIVAGNALAAEKQQVRDFYDAFGWEKDAGVYYDTLVHEDLRTLSLEYAHRCHLRVMRYLNRSKGELLLDVGSGPVQYPDYRAFHEPFSYRICVDISQRALQEAKTNIGDRGIYVLADATNLPLADGSVDAVVSLHLLYHIPSDEQQLALTEILRVLKPGSLAVLVYLWGFRSPIGSSLYWLRGAAKNHRRISRVRGLRQLFPDKPQLYVYSHDLGWLRHAAEDSELDIRAYRSLSPTFMKLFVHERLLGRQILNGVAALEDRLPHLMGRLGRYPLIVARKPPLSL